MQQRPLKWSYHDGGLASYTVGPRREVSLTCHLNPVIEPTGGIVHVRFGGIENLQQVADFLSKLDWPPIPDAYLATIDALVCGRYQSGLQEIVLDLDRYGAVSIVCRHVSEG